MGDSDEGPLLGTVRVPPTRMNSRFDPTFDFRTEATGKRPDPDATSPTLRAYHKLLWSKPLPNGDSFELTETTPRMSLRHRSKRGEYRLASDSAIPTFIRYRRMAHIIPLIPKSEEKEFDTITYQMGGMMLFPGNKIGGRPTINGARGLYRRISDRLDLTVECIRLHYLGETSPLADVLDRYSDFFALFEDFNGFVGFFLLQDLASEDRAAVKFFMSFDGFGMSPLPASVEAYKAYRQNAVGFVQARNRRMAEYVAGR